MKYWRRDDFHGLAHYLFHIDTAAQHLGDTNLVKLAADCCGADLPSPEEVVRLAGGE